MIENVLGIEHFFELFFFKPKIDIYFVKRIFGILFLYVNKHHTVTHTHLDSQISHFLDWP